MSGVSTLVLQFKVDGVNTSLQQVNQFRSGIESAANSMNARWAGPLMSMESGIDRLSSKLETGITRGFYAGAAAAGTFAFAMAGLSRSFVEVNQKFAEFEITLASSLKSVSAARAITTQVAKVTATSPLPFKDIAESITGLTILPSLNQKFARDARMGTLGSKDGMFMRSKELVEMMSTFRPDKRPEEAVFSIREALSGQWRSILRRFDVPLSIFSDAAGGKSIQRITSEGPDAIFNSIYKAFSRIISPEAVKQRAQMPSVALENIYEQMFQLPALQTGRSGLMQHVGKRLNNVLSGTTSFFGADASGGPSGFESGGHAQRMSDSLVKVFDAMIEGLSRTGETILNSFGYSGGKGTFFERAAQALSDGINRFATNLPGYIDQTVKIGGDLLELAKDLFEVFKEITGYLVSLYDKLKSEFGTTAAVLGILSAPSAVIGGTSGILKSVIGGISGGVSSRYADAINPMAALMGKSSFAANAVTQTANGAMRLTAADALLMANLGVTSAAGNPYKSGQLVGASTRGAVASAAGGVVTAAGWASLATGVVALSGVIATGYTLFKAFREGKEAIDAMTNAALSFASANGAIGAMQKEATARKSAAQSFAGVTDSAESAGLANQRSEAEQLLEIYSRGGNNSARSSLNKRLGLLSGSSSPYYTQESRDFYEKAIRRRFTRAQINARGRNGEANPGGYIGDFMSVMAGAQGRKSIEDHFDELGMPSAQTFTGSSQADVTRQRLAGNFQDSDQMMQSDIMRQYIKEIDEGIAHRLERIKELDTYLNGSDADKQWETAKTQLFAMRAAIAGGTLGGFKDQQAFDERYAEILKIATASSNPYRSQGLAVRGAGVGANSDALRNSLNNQFFFSQGLTSNFITQAGNASSSPALRALLSNNYASDTSGILSSSDTMLKLMGSQRSTLGMESYEKLNTEIENTLTQQKALTIHVQDYKDTIANAAFDAEQSSVAQAALRIAQDKLADTTDRLAQLQQSRIDMLHAQSTRGMRKAFADSEAAYFDARGEGATFSTAFERNRRANSATLGWEDSRSNGFGEGFSSQFARGDDFGSYAQAGIDAANAIKDAFGGAFADIVLGTKNVGEAFQAMAGSILKAMANILAQKAAEWLLTMMFSSMGGMFKGGRSVDGSATNMAVFGDSLQGPAAVPQGRAAGGMIYGGSGVRDDVPAMLMGGEYVLNKKAVASIGRAQLDAWNSGTGVRRFASGGYVGSYSNGGTVVHAPTSMNAVNVTVNYSSGGARTEQAEGNDNGEGMKEMNREIETMVIQVIEKHERRRRAQQR